MVSDQHFFSAGFACSKTIQDRENSIADFNPTIDKKFSSMWGLAIKEAGNQASLSIDWKENFRVVFETTQRMISHDQW